MVDQLPALLRLPMGQDQLKAFARGCKCYRDTRRGRDPQREKPGHWRTCPAWEPLELPTVEVEEPLSPEMEETLF